MHSEKTEKKTRNRIVGIQKQLLIDLVRNYFVNTVGHYYCVQINDISDDNWSYFAEELNQVGPAKTAKEWKNSLANMRNRIRNKPLRDDDNAEDTILKQMFFGKNLKYYNPAPMVSIPKDSENSSLQSTIVGNVYKTLPASDEFYEVYSEEPSTTTIPRMNSSQSDSKENVPLVGSVQSPNESSSYMDTPDSTLLSSNEVDVYNNSPDSNLFCEIYYEQQEMPSTTNVPLIRASKPVSKEKNPQISSVLSPDEIEFYMGTPGPDELNDVVFVEEPMYAENDSSEFVPEPNSIEEDEQDGSMLVTEVSRDHNNFRCSSKTNKIEARSLWSDFTGRGGLSHFSGRSIARRRFPDFTGRTPGVKVRGRFRGRGRLSTVKTRGGSNRGGSQQKSLANEVYDGDEIAESYKRIPSVQKDRLLQLLQNRFLSVVGRYSGSNGVELKRDMWDQISNELNLLGPTRTAIQWKNTLDYMKASCKQKLADLRCDFNKTGGGSRKVKDLTEQDELLISIYGIDNLDGDQRLDEGGFTFKPSKTKITKRSIHRDNIGSAQSSVPTSSQTVTNGRYVDLAANECSSIDSGTVQTTSMADHIWNTLSNMRSRTSGFIILKPPRANVVYRKASNSATSSDTPIPKDDVQPPQKVKKGSKKPTNRLTSYDMVERSIYNQERSIDAQVKSIEQSNKNHGEMFEMFKSSVGKQFLSVKMKRFDFYFSILDLKILEIQKSRNPMLQKTAILLQIVVMLTRFFLLIKVQRPDKKHFSNQ